MQLFRVFGIRIGVDHSWFLVVFLIIWSLSSTYKEVFPGEETKAFVLATASALLFFLSVVLHELGHARVAIRNGIGIAGIDLWLFGGVAKMRRDTGSPGVDFRVAIGGPLVTLAIAGVCVGAGTLLMGAEGFRDAILLQPHAGVGSLEAVLGLLALVNTMLLFFNLLPAFPLDGGRIVRAIAWWRTGDRGRATAIAAAIGRAFAYLLASAGLFVILQGDLFSGLWFLLIALFIGQGARSEVLQTQITAPIQGMRVADVMDAEPVAVLGTTKLDRVLEEFFLRYRWPWFPVVDNAGRLIGLVSRQKVDAVPEALRPDWTADAVMTIDGAGDLRVTVEEPLETLLGFEALHRLGAIMAVDDDGILRGVVTIADVRRALRPAAPVV